jgi:hypothetical protein
MATSIIVHDGIGPRVTGMAVGLAARVAVAAQAGAEQLENYARFNAPWSDDTGAARAGLTAGVSIENGEVVIELAHTVDYGIWLETIQDGQFAIIMPTIEALGTEVVAAAGAAVIMGGGF